MPIEKQWPAEFTGIETTITKTLEETIKEKSYFSYLIIPQGVNDHYEIVNVIKGSSISVFNLYSTIVTLYEGEAGNLLATIQPYTVLTIPIPEYLNKIKIAGRSDGLQDYRIPYIITNKYEKFAGKVSSIDNVKIYNINQTLGGSQTLYWNGTSTTQSTSDIYPGVGEAIMLLITNTAGVDLTVTFSHKYNNNYYQWFDGAGNPVSFVVKANSSRAYGPIQKFPRFDAGIITCTAATAPASGTETVIQLQEV
ncbi:MAG: hypothetical protein QXF82_00795 [Nitrososphaeria archaeon]